MEPRDAHDTRYAGYGYGYGYILGPKFFFFEREETSTLLVAALVVLLRVNTHQSKPTTDNREWTPIVASNSPRAEMSRTGASRSWAKEEARVLRRKAQQGSWQHQAAGGRGPRGPLSRPRTREAAPRSGRTTVPSPPPVAQWHWNSLRRHRRKRSSKAFSSGCGTRAAVTATCSRPFGWPRGHTRTRRRSSRAARATSTRCRTMYA